eukprot:GFYU01001244.1.p1 GENE.GFYU01001244.1~~GFYU01001244.1.p1  ORF type:complete len:834 (+),score=307.27 GFYU01001244.1:140-2641(+)
MRAILFVALLAVVVAGVSAQDFCSQPNVLLQNYNSLLGSSYPSELEAIIDNFMKNAKARSEDRLRKQCMEDASPMFAYGRRTQCSHVVKELITEGYKTWSSSQSVNSFSHLADAGAEKFLQYLESKVAVPEEYMDSWKSTLESILQSDTDPVVYRVVSCDSTGECSYLLLLAQHFPTLKNTDLLVVKQGATFELAPNLLIVRRTTTDGISGAGRDTEDVISEHDRSVTQDDLDQVMDFFEIISFSALLGESPDLNQPATLTAEARQHVDFLHHARLYHRMGYVPVVPIDLTPADISAKVAKDSAAVAAKRTILRSSAKAYAAAAGAGTGTGTGTGTGAVDPDKKAPAEPDMHKGKSTALSFLDKMYQGFTKGDLGKCATDVATGSLFGPVGAAVGGFVCMWSDIVAAFKSSHTSQLIGELQNNGWRHFTQDQVGPFYTESIPVTATDFSGKVVHPLKMLLCQITKSHLGDVPERISEDLQEHLYLIANGWVSGEDVVAGNSIHYTTEAGGSGKSAKFLFNGDPLAGKSSVLFYATNWPDIKLAPRLFVYRDCTSVLGGIWSSCKDEIHERPREITLDDVNTLNDFADVMAFKAMGTIIGLCSRLGDCKDFPPLPSNSTSPVMMLAADASPVVDSAALTSAGDQFGAVFASEAGSVTNEQVNNVLHRGFGFFDQKGMVQHLTYKREQASNLAGLVIRTINAPQTLLDDLKVIVELTEFSTDGSGAVWSYSHLAYSAGSTSNANFASFLVRGSSADSAELDMWVYQTTVNFNLLPDVIYLNSCHSAVFGLVHHCHTVRHEIPRALTEGDLLVLTDFFNTLAFKALGVNYSKHLIA